MKAVESFSLLKRFAKSSPSDKKIMLRLFGNELLDALGEISLNISKNKVDMSPSRRKTLLRYRDEIITLADKKVSRKHKKKIISQKGGLLLPLLLSPAISILSEILGKKLAEARRHG